IQKTAELVQEIASASTEQNSGAEQISKAITQLDSVIQQNASASEEMASTSEELSSQSALLENTMSFFKVSGYGSSNFSQPRALPISHNPVDLPMKEASASPPASAPKPVAKAQTSDMGGLSLDMEADDSDFEKF
ncbi:methyl-accepting chemotaxis protein, partial [Aduncisulcus paluster]